MTSGIEERGCYRDDNIFGGKRMYLSESAVIREFVDFGELKKIYKTEQ